MKVIKLVDLKVVDFEGGEGSGVFVIDDLVDIGKILKVVCEMLFKVYYVMVYVKLVGVFMVDIFIMEVF